MNMLRSTFGALASLLLFAGCTGSSESEDGSASAETSASTGTSEGAETTGPAPTPGPPLPDTSACEVEDAAVLFGSPSANTGLGAEQCGPSCACSGGAWTPPSYDEDFAVGLDALELLDPPPLLGEDPYAATPGASPDPTMVCAAVFEAEDPSAYRLVTYPDALAAVAEGGWITHSGACGQCSSLANLAVYLRRPDLTEPVRSCGLDGILDGEQANIECLMALGFDEACAQIWYYNTNHTRTECLDVCLAELENPNHLPDGSLNPCIQCDEDESGAVFKAVSGRTRRNSGLPSALCRPCDSVYRVTHDYGLGAG